MVIGNFEGGGGRTEVISTTSTFTTYDVFTDGSVFDNVVVESRISGAIGAEPGFAIDNISLTPVPKPASMVALGLGAVALMRRRKKTA